MASSIVSETDTSDVATTSTDARCRWKTSKVVRKKALGEQHPRRAQPDQRDAAFPGDRRHGATRRVEGDERSLPLRPPRVEDEHGDAEPHRWVDRHRMEHLGAERCELRCLVEADALEHAVRPSTTRGSAVSIPSTSVQISMASACERGAHERRAVVRPAAAEGRR